MGPLAGPVVAAAVVLPSRVDLLGLDDSKQVRRAERERLAKALRAQSVGVGIGVVEVEGLFAKQLTRVAIVLYQRWINTVTTDAEGRFAVPMFAGEGTNFTVEFQLGDRKSDEGPLRLVDEELERVLKDARGGTSADGEAALA